MVGPMEAFGTEGCFRVTAGNGKYWTADGVGKRESDIVAKWSEGPIRERTIKEIVEGRYGELHVVPHEPGCVLIGLHSADDQQFSSFTATELTAVIETLTAIRDALDEVAA